MLISASIDIGREAAEGERQTNSGNDEYRPCLLGDRSANLRSFPGMHRIIGTPADHGVL